MAVEPAVCVWNCKLLVSLLRVINHVGGAGGGGLCLLPINAMNTGSSWQLSSKLKYTAGIN